MFKEFKDFAMRGGLIDTAVGLVMGAAFAKVTSAFVDGIFMPLVSMIVQSDFSGWKSVLKPAILGADGKETAAEVAVKYGDLVGSILNFIIVAFVMFLVVKAMNSVKKQEEAAPAAPPVQEVLLGEIRDLLKSGR